MTERHLTDTRFDSLGIQDAILQGLHDTGFTRCTPIQAATLPVALAGHDVAGQAQTGTGKTAAFLIACFNRLLNREAPPERRANQPRALILAPTRELAIQIHKDAEALGRHVPLTLGLVYGGVDYEKQRRQLEEGIDILIGTPGRIIDYFKQRVFDLRAAEVVVLDEADRMFDLGFIKDIRFLMRRCPPPEQRLSMLFSATLSYRVMELAYEHMNNPETVRIEAEQMTAERVRQRVYYPANEEKIPLLLGLLAADKPERSIVFTNTKRSAEYVASYLEGNGYHVALLSGDVPQKKRQHLLKAFAAGEATVMVATDVAARGLHIPDVSHVFNYDLPQSGEDYVHRIGRTARAGAEGDAISFACEDTAFYLPEIEEYIGTRIDMESVDPALLVKPQPRVRHAKPKDRPHGSGGKPKSAHAPKEGAPGNKRRRSRRGRRPTPEQHD
ncbi:MAG: ATP-dependent RNA helicase RhlB [Gammaproteobacteria bacterium]|jgi:ATP-dependent RNA helicase RhlB